ncbi:MAG: TonB family protein [Bacteroidetes bacterium]|nr:TonB family protein [Bacteroidota bacterium]
MKTQTLILATADDVIFCNRNHDYGAYNIRATYTKNLTHATAIAFSMAFAFALWVFIDGYLNQNKVIDKPDTWGKEIIISKPPILPKILDPKVEEIKAPETSAKRNVTPVVVERQTKIDPIPTKKDLESATNFGDNDKKGKDEKTIIVEATPIPTVVIPDKPREWAEVMPQFPGGEGAMSKFIATHLEYPSLALEMGLQGKVYVEFVVKDDGSISDINLRKDIAGGCGNAALKMVAQMPPWKPGSHNGKAVPVIIRIPIDFRINR